MLTNALKFTPAGGEVRLSAIVRDDNLVINVEDDGPGIPKEHHESVFERFYQLHRETDNKDPGTGLGLTICRHFVELHGGRIFLENKVDGAHFTCVLPLKFIEAAAA